MKLNIFISEQFKSVVENNIRDLNYEDLNVITYPDNHSSMEITETVRNLVNKYEKYLLFVNNNQPDLKKLAAEIPNLEVIEFNLHPTCQNFIKNILKYAVNNQILCSEISRQEKTISDENFQCEEISGIINFTSEIASYTEKNDVVEKIKDLYEYTMGASSFEYWNYSDGLKMPESVKALYLRSEQYLFNADDNSFGIKIENNGKFYGAILAGNFLHPESALKYLKYSFHIVKIAGLVFSNIEQNEKQRDSDKAFEYLSYHDILTGLYNRTFLNHSFKFNENIKNIAVFMFDIDNLKYVNDNYGHADGDKLIISAAEVMKNSFRVSDIIARFGGDEFIVILPECDADSAEKIKERIKEAIEDNNKNLESPELKLSISYGYVVSESSDFSLSDLTKKADDLMYENKLKKHATDNEYKIRRSHMTS